MKLPLSLSIALSCFIAALGAALAEKTLYPLSFQEEIRFVPNKQIVELLCLDHRGFAADILFVRVNLHSGSLMWKPLEFTFDSTWSYGIMDIITDLDPRYYVAYLFSAMGLVHNFDDVKRARPIMEKGMQVFPDSWEMPFWAGYGYYAYFQDYAVAGDYFWQAYQKPDSPKSYMALMLSALRHKGDYTRALDVLSAMYSMCNDDQVKPLYAKKMLQLKNLILLQHAAESFQTREGRMPETIDELVRAGVIDKLPEDPLSMRYVFDSAKGIVTVQERPRP